MPSRPGKKSAGEAKSPECGPNESAPPRGGRSTLSLGLSDAGLALGTAFFAISLTPSLLPRPFAVQGLLSGLCFTAGYGAGTGLVSLGRHFQLPAASPQTLRITRWVLGTGWIDPASQTAVEYLHRGDIATVAAQYSYLTLLQLAADMMVGSAPPGFGHQDAQPARTPEERFRDLMDRQRAVEALQQAGREARRNP